MFESKSTRYLLSKTKVAFMERRNTYWGLTDVSRADYRQLFVLKTQLSRKSFPAVVIVALLGLQLALCDADELPADEHTTKNEKCFDVDQRHNCLFMSLSWRSEWTYGQQFCTSHEGTLVNIITAEWQTAVEKYASESQLAWFVRAGAKLKLELANWFWKSWSHKYDVNKLSNHSTVADYRTHAAIKQVVDGFEMVARNPVDELPYICQYKAGSKSCGDSKSRLDIGRWCYVFHSTGPVTWYQARNKCLDEDGDLAMFEDINSLAKHRLPSLTPYWILLRNSYWEWSDGSEMLYSNWGRGQPNNADKTCMVLDYRDPWKWASHDCTEKLDFICQKNSYKPVCANCIAILPVALGLVAAVAWFIRRQIRRCRYWIERHRYRHV